MTDPRFFCRHGPFSLGDIARRIGAELSNPAADQLAIHDIAALDSAGPGDLGLFHDPRYGRDFAATRAGAVGDRRLMTAA